MDAVDDIFTPISTDVPLFDVYTNHPVRPKSLKVSDKVPLQTNKFYANLFLGSQSQGVWLHPFSIWWSRGNAGLLRSWGLSVSHVERNQKAYGPDPSADPVQYYINPIGIQSFTFSAAEFTPALSYISLDSPTQFSVNLRLHLGPGEHGRRITFPLLQGCGFITGIYADLTPQFESGVFFHQVRQETHATPGVSKWRLLLEDGRTWLLYAHSFNGESFTLKLSNNSRLQASSRFTGAIQLTKISEEAPPLEAVTDACTGAWPAGMSIAGSVGGDSATYTFDYVKAGSASTRLLMYALPHHVQSFDRHTASHVQSRMGLQSTTKGFMTAIVSDRWVMTETDLSSTVGFSPIDLAGSSALEGLSASAKQIIRRTATEESKQDAAQQSDLDSMYFSGKAVDKFACLAWAAWEALKDAELVGALLEKVRDALARFVENRQKFPLAYDGVWKGLVTTAIYKTGDLMSDFGNGCYNDHHFHYGYFVHAAAVVARLDKELYNTTTWLDAHRDFIDDLVRDAANPSEQDVHFPVSRAFDWFHGHSWAKGLFESADGKDQESTSEDAYFSYALKLWGTVTGDKATEARGTLMLAIQRRVFRNYFLMENSNVNQPPRFVKNKVTGILFENKCDHATYFGLETQFIQGIHMIPVSPISPYIRSSKFVQEEWSRYFSGGRVDKVEGGWRGILYANYALVDPRTAWEFFASENFKNEWLDQGASRTWYLILAAGKWTSCTLVFSITHSLAAWCGGNI
ncbi:glycoside hydrolase family 81 protein [Neolentinus lepideus HHB14362 ss-1]|uniref:glucan endo-1,3-beta-D-glucosidase n=1 Tax=Neolentinus lepideus HHB14362 ss-1 TaxID=1314782 RepID=A0A165RM02_9AGAM|nr:glycoside hydrolase family 81 protein [Neolentinus lepideus HHB14362 ss-1]